MNTSKTFDIIVIGGGHAAIEAALAPARMGLRVAMITLDPARVGQMSCNPAVGGTAKGQVVREIDALGGEMARATDRAGLQFRMLNRGKGPAVWSPRVQTDRVLYRTVMTDIVSRQENLTLIADEAVDFIESAGRIGGVVGSSGVRYEARAVIVGTGTFLNGLSFTAASRPRPADAATSRRPRTCRRRCAASDSPSDGSRPARRCASTAEPSTIRFARFSPATRTRCRCLISRGACRRNRFPAGSRTRTSARTRSSATTWTARRSIPGRFPRPASATARRSKTRS